MMTAAPATPEEIEGWRVIDLVPDHYARLPVVGRFSRGSALGAMVGDHA
jgi:hypothetical protein